MASHGDAAAAAAEDGIAALGISGGGGGEWAEECAPLRRNLLLVSPGEVELAKMFLDEGQGHLFKHWPDSGVDDDKKGSFFDQVCRLNSCYPGGLVSYIQNARRLLADSKAGKNPYDGFTPSVALPRETTTGKCFLQHYIECILALQEASCKIVEGFWNSYFGMEPSQIKVLKQGKVACLADNDARHALDPNDKYKIQTKPHGHGDVHSLLYSSGLLEQRKSAWSQMGSLFPGYKRVALQGNTNSIGCQCHQGYNVNSLAVPRKAKEAIGGITKLTHADGRMMVINVEYNRLDPLLRATGHPDGDVNCETGYSPYPGNINQVKLTGQVQNKGWDLRKVGYNDTSAAEEIRIRRVMFDKVEQLEVNYIEPGKHRLSA